MQFALGRGARVIGSCSAAGPLADAIPALVELEAHHQPKGKLIIEPAGEVPDSRR